MSFPFTIFFSFQIKGLICESMAVCSSLLYYVVLLIKRLHVSEVHIVVSRCFVCHQVIRTTSHHEQVRIITPWSHILGQDLGYPAPALTYVFVIYVFIVTEVRIYTLNQTCSSRAGQGTCTVWSKSICNHTSAYWQKRVYGCGRRQKTNNSESLNERDDKGGVPRKGDHNRGRSDRGKE